MRAVSSLFLFGLCCAVGCSDFTINEEPTSSSTSAQATAGAGGAMAGAGGSTPASSGVTSSGGMCMATMTLPNLIGGTNCASCMGENHCDDFIACDQAMCNDIGQCYAGCAYQDTPCLADCLMQFDQTSIAAWNAIASRFNAGSPCFDACGMTDLKLCGSPISAVTQACAKEGIACCAPISDCSRDPLCLECANGTNPSSGVCDQNPFFKAMTNCLMALPNKACSW